MKTTQVAIIGAGMAGCYSASLLTRAGYKVTVVEKSRGSGGRASSRRTQFDQSCDLGAPYFLHKYPELDDDIRLWQDNKVMRYFPIGDADGFDAFTGMPRMSAMTRFMLKDIDLQTETRVHNISPVYNKDQQIDGWVLRDDRYRPILQAQYLVITAPAPQAAQLLASPHTPPQWLLDAHKASALCEPQWSAYITPKKSIKDPEVLMEPEQGPLARIICDSAKPGRVRPPQRWVVQATTEWSRAHQDTPAEQVADTLLTAFQQHTGFEQELEISQPHRWLLGRQTPIEGAPFRWSMDAHMGLAGDWLKDGDVAGALFSAYSLCQAIQDDNA